MSATKRTPRERALGQARAIGAAIDHLYCMVALWDPEIRSAATFAGSALQDLANRLAALPADFRPPKSPVVGRYLGQHVWPRAGHAHAWLLEYALPFKVLRLAAEQPRGKGVSYLVDVETADGKTLCRLPLSLLTLRPKKRHAPGGEVLPELPGVAS